MLDTLGAEDAKRIHVARCARCSAMLVAYREFVRAGAPGRAQLRDADSRLAAFIAQRVEGVEVTAGAPRRPRGRWFEIPTFRFAAAAAAMVLVAFALTRFLPNAGDEVVLRGAPRAVFSLEPSRTLADGALELSWAPVANADSYQVTILGTDLSEVFRTPATSETRVTLEAGSLPAEATRWQVTALREGAMVAESSPAALRPKF
jgi:hypothetical protein